MFQTACCTCATLLTAVPRVSTSSEKPLPEDRRLDCCGRIICGDCIHRNVRFLNYCPYCQTSGRLPLSPSCHPTKHRSKKSEPDAGSDSDPPPYYPPTDNDTSTNPPPPPYTPTPPLLPTSPPPSPPSPPPPTLPQPDLKHTSTPKDPHTNLHNPLPPAPPQPHPDTIGSLSLQYGIPLSILRLHNKIPSDADFLLAARHTLLIPTAYITNFPHNASPHTTATGGSTNGNGTNVASFSPNPRPPASRDRKTAIRRWMVACKEADYDVALVYLDESGWKLEEAVERYWGDAEWERGHPLERGWDGKGKGKGRNLRGG